MKKKMYVVPFKECSIYLIASIMKRNKNKQFYSIIINPAFFLVLDNFQAIVKKVPHIKRVRAEDHLYFLL